MITLAALKIMLFITVPLAALLLALAALSDAHPPRPRTKEFDHEV